MNRQGTAVPCSDLQDCVGLQEPPEPILDPSRFWRLPVNGSGTTGFLSVAGGDHVAETSLDIPNRQTFFDDFL